MYKYLESFKTDNKPLSCGYFLELVLLVEYSVLFIYFIYILISLTIAKRNSIRSKILLFALIASSGIRIVLFVPKDLVYSNTIMVIDVFTVPVCYFTAVSAIISEWYDAFVLSRWCNKFETKYILIRRFTQTNLIVNVVLWTVYAGTIAFAEFYNKSDLQQ